ncbi:MAG: FAD synthetase family protein [Alistipes sp.]|nr:FAD synthetase family protein [Alistipes sp.]
MTISYGIEGIPTMGRRVVTVGSFDGVHAGHSSLLERLRTMAHRLDAESVVVTFDPHPRMAMGRAEGMQLLTTIEERAYLLGRYGIDRLVVAHFDERFRTQSYEEFIRSLVEGVGMVGMVVGYNHRFGRGSEGNYEVLLPLSTKYGFEVERVEQHSAEGHKVSSTVVRNVVQSGDMSLASQLLDHPYIIIGSAKQGVLHPSADKLLPPSGRYAAHINGLAATVDIRNREVYVEGLCEDVIIEIY